MRYALIQNDIVMEITEWNGEGDIFNDYLTVPVDGIHVDKGWRYVNGEFIDPSPTPNPSNKDLLKIDLTALSLKYQEDIEKLNRAWLAAAVNDGINETAKKDLILAQINTRKTQYANDRSSIIDLYP